MSNVINSLNYLYDVRNDIKDAIADKTEQEVTVPFVNYADLINEIPDAVFSEERSNKLQFWMTFENSTVEDKTVFEQFDMTAKNGNFGEMFLNCKNLKYGPELNSTIKVAINMFKGCSSLISIPDYDTSDCEDFLGMFEGCTNLTTVPKLKIVKDNTSYYDGTPVNRMFKNCKSLTEINFYFGVSGCFTNLDETFYGCSNLTTLGLLRFSSYATNFKGFYGCYKLTNVAGFYNLDFDLELDHCPLLTYESLANIINDMRPHQPGGLFCTLKLHPDAAARLTDDLIKKATDKGWTISY